MTQDGRVLVVGGGVAGLSTAIGLSRAGVEPAVFERASALREVGAGVVISVAGMAALERLGRGDAIQAVGCAIDTNVHRSRSGRLLAQLSVGRRARERGLLPPRAVRRADLVAVLVDGLTDGSSVRLRSDGRGFDQDERGVTLRLSNGYEQRGIALIGADGINSRIRAQLFPLVRPRALGYQSLRAITRFDHPALVPGVVQMTYGRGDRFGVACLGEGWLWWFGVIVAPEGTADGPGGRKADLIDRFRGFHDPIPALIEATPEGAILRHDVRDIEPLPHWGEGRVVLVGDAAHAASVAGGEGVSQAIVDGAAIGRVVGSLSRSRVAAELPAAMEEFQHLRLRAATQVQGRSRRAGQRLSWTNPLACAYRDVHLRITGKNRMTSGLDAELAASAAAAGPGAPGSASAN